MRGNFEMDNVRNVKVWHEGENMVVTFNDGHTDMHAVLTPDQMQELNFLTLNYCPGMPGFIQFHEDRLNQD